MLIVSLKNSSAVVDWVTIEVVGNVVRSIGADQVGCDEIPGMAIEVENLSSDARQQINEIIRKLRSENATGSDASA